MTVIVTKKATCENAGTQVALDFDGFWRFILTTLGGGRSILLSYGCMALIYKASSVFRLHVVANISNTFLPDVRTGSDKFRKLFEHAFANSEDFLSTSCHPTISAFHRWALAGLYLRRSKKAVSAEIRRCSSKSWKA